MNDYDKNDRKVIEKCGIISSIIGIIINIFLTISKFFIGSITNSVAITADAINNLSDASSSIVSFVSFKYSNKPADKDHPFGHERFEYIATFIVSAFIINYGFSIFIDSIKKILHNNNDLHFTKTAVFIIILSIILKLFIFLFNYKLSKKINSNVLKATAIDSLSDILATSCIFLSLIIYKYFNINIDYYVGIGVSLFILYSGFKIVKESIDNILGVSFDDNVSKEIIDFIKNYNSIIIGTHDFLVHNYGSKNFATIHVEVSYKEDFLKTHDIIDNIEMEVLNKFDVNLVIHLDPVITDNKEVNVLKNKTLEIVKNIDYSLDIHDFRIIFGKEFTSLIFEIEVPFDLKLSDNDIISIVNDKITDLNKNLYCTIKIDRI